MPRTLLWLAVSLHTSLMAQQVCPPISFQLGAITRLYGATASGLSIMARQPGGGYSLNNYVSSGINTYTKNSSTPDAQRVLATCYGGPARTFGALPAPPTARLGQYSMEAIWADFNRDGIGAGVGIYSRISTSGVIFASPGPDLTPRPHTILPAGENPVGVTAADFNNDGRPDIAVLNFGPYAAGNAQVAVLLNNGNASFSAPITRTVGGNAMTLTAYDLNGDGNVDLAVATQAFSAGATSQITVLLGNGDGSFRVGATIAAAEYPRAVVAGDFNGDGKADLVFGSQSSSVTVLGGNGDGTFKTGVKTNTGSPAGFLVPADFNKDGKLDLAFTDSTSSVIGVLLGDGAYNFPTRHQYLGDSSMWQIMAADVDADGNPDLVIGAGDASILSWNANSGNLSVLFGRGDGTLIGAEAFDIGSGAAAPVVADFNGDGVADAATMSASGSLLVVRPQSGGKPGVISRTATSISGASQLLGLDVNRDGRLDILAAGSSGLVWLPGQGDGSFGARNTISSDSFTTAALADLNGDGRPDLVAASPGTSLPSDNGRVQVFLATAAGGFAPGATLTPGSKPTALVLADLNGDSRPDLVVANGGVDFDASRPGSVTVHLGNGDGTFGTGTALQGLGVNPYLLATGDVNSDGRSDLFVVSRTTSFGWQLHLLIGNGNGTFAAPALYATDFGPNSLALADFSGDGKLDLLVGHCCGDTQTGYYLSNGDGTFAAERMLPGSQGFFRLTPGDLDNNGQLDVAALASDTQGGALILLRNIGVRTGPLNVLSAASFTGAAVAPDSIVSLFGSGLDGALTGLVRDAVGVAKPLTFFFTSPAQANALLPAGLAPGPAVVQVTNTAGAVATGETRIADTAPGVFVLNAAGLVAANLLRVSAAGVQTYEPVYEVDAGGAVVARAIDFGDTGDQLYLLVYGTGIRGRGKKPSVSVTIGSRGYPVQYAGAQGEFPGLDQVNVQLQRATLAGAGELSLTVRVDNVAANVAKIRFR